MSRIGKLPVVVPEKVDVKINGAEVSVKGPNGSLDYTFTDKVKIELKDKEVLVTPVDESKEARSLWGTTRTLINNMVTGVTTGFTKTLEYNGVGYKAAVSGSTITLNLGYSHPINFDIPTGIEIEVEKATTVHVKGADKALVGQTAAEIREFRPPEPYLGKGIRYSDEHIRRKAGKSAGK